MDGCAIFSAWGGTGCLIQMIGDEKYGHDLRLIILWRDDDERSLPPSTLAHVSPRQAISGAAVARCQAVWTGGASGRWRITKTCCYSSGSGLPHRRSNAGSCIWLCDSLAIFIYRHSRQDGEAGLAPGHLFVHNSPPPLKSDWISTSVLFTLEQGGHAVGRSGGNSQSCLLRFLHEKVKKKKKSESATQARGHNQSVNQS